MTDQRPVTPPPIDETAIARFVDVVFGALNGHVPVRLLAEKGTPHRPPHAFSFDTAELLDGLIKAAPVAARASRAVFVVPGTTATAGSARADDIVATAVILADLDAGDIDGARDHLERHLGPASLVVASGGRAENGQEKLHLYWRLADPAAGDDLERVRALREAIALAVGGDPSFKSLHQPIRVPGTIHGKHGQHTVARIVADSGEAVGLDDFEARVAALPPLGGLRRKLFTIDTGFGPSAADLSTQTIRAGGVDAVTRFDGLSRVIGHWIRTARLGRCSLEEAWAAVAEHNVAMIVPPWEEARLQREFDALYRRDREQYPDAWNADPGEHPETHHSDDDLAALFITTHGTDWRHVPAWGAWYHWSGMCWQRDEPGFIREQVRRLCREAAVDCEKAGEIRRIRSEKTITAIVRVVATDPAVATRVADWDAHPMLLNTPAGVVDLASGEIRDHDPSLLLSQMTAASPGSGCPRWMRFLYEITGGDPELEDYLQRLSGYLLTGSTSEQVFAFFHGSGANGKSVFIQTLAAVLGDYAATATLDTFMASQVNRHLTELAGLRAARMVVVPETDPGRAWAEGRIKTVTGGEKVRANFMHRDHFEYIPQFKLIVAGNHRPALAGTGEAMRRRLHLVPFAVTVPPEARDRDLVRKLAAERDGILGWMLEGCAAWQQAGLAPPPIILEAAKGYFADEDLVGQWIEESCQTGPEYRATSQALFASWSAWAEAGGHPKGTQKSLGEALRQKGFEGGKVNRGRGWKGLCPRRAGDAGGRED